MIWGSRIGAWNRGGQLLALIAAFMWSLLPILCPQAEAVESRHSHAAFAGSEDHGEGHAHQHHDSNQCCNVLAGAKFLAPTAAIAPAPKVVVVAAIAIVAKLTIDNRQVTDTLSAHEATGPRRGL